jgi:hypothetical protein
MEAEMRVSVATLVGLMALAATSVQAAPIPVKPTQVSLGPSPLIELVAQGCGWGWHRAHWRDRWGYWHWEHCVPEFGAEVSAPLPRHEDWCRT